MSGPAPITTAILDAVLDTLARHFLAATGGDLVGARRAASRMLACHNAMNEQQLRLAGDIVRLDLQALEALGAAAAAGLSLDQTLRLRRKAVSLSRNAHRARGKLDRLKRAGVSAVRTVTVIPLPRAA